MDPGSLVVLSAITGFEGVMLARELFWSVSSKSGKLEDGGYGLRHVSRTWQLLGDEVEEVDRAAWFLDYIAISSENIDFVCKRASWDSCR
jgi:hypothetical protein